MVELTDGGWALLRAQRRETDEWPFDRRADLGSHLQDPACSTAKGTTFPGVLQAGATWFESRGRARWRLRRQDLSSG